jgi:SnoaL-like protein
VELSDVHAVQSVVTEVLHAIDMRGWTRLPSLFTTDVTTDCTSLFGGDVQRQHRQQLIDGWRQMLSPLDATQHLLGPIIVTGDAARAVLTATCAAITSGIKPQADVSGWSLATTCSSCR